MESENALRLITSVLTQARSESAATALVSEPASIAVWHKGAAGMDCHAAIIPGFVCLKQRTTSVAVAEFASILSEMQRNSECVAAPGEINEPEQVVRV